MLQPHLGEHVGIHQLLAPGLHRLWLVGDLKRLPRLSACLIHAPGCCVHAPPPGGLLHCEADGFICRDKGGDGTHGAALLGFDGACRRR